MIEKDMLTFNCLYCNNSLKIPKGIVSKGQCPFCEQVIIVPKKVRKVSQ